MIGIDETDTSPEAKDGYLFSLELNTRVYTLRAKTQADAEAWVKVLKKLQAEGGTVSNPMSTSAMKGRSAILAAENGGQGGGDWSKADKLQVLISKICPCLLGKFKS